MTHRLNTARTLAALVALATLASGCAYGLELLNIRKPQPDTFFGFVEFESDQFEWNWYDQEHNVEPRRFTAEYTLKRDGRTIGTGTDSGEMDRTIRHRVVLFDKAAGGALTRSDLADGSYELVMDRSSIDRVPPDDEKVAFFTVEGGELLRYDGPEWMPEAPKDPDGVRHYRFSQRHDHD